MRTWTWRSVICVSALLAMLIGSSSVWGAQVSLFGATQSHQTGVTTLVRIDAATGQPTTVADYPVNPDLILGALTYHDPSGKFLLSAHSGSVEPQTPTLIVLDPVVGGSQQIPITGLPAGQEKILGLEYSASRNQILMTFGASEPFPVEDFVAEIDLAGVVLGMSANLGLLDRDWIAEDPSTGNLLLFDLNSENEHPRVAIVDDVFGAATVTPFANPPLDHQVRDPAISATGEIFTVLRTEPNDLLRIEGDAYVTVGPIGLTHTVQSLAFGVPEPSTLGLLTVACLAVGLRRRSRR